MVEVSDLNTVTMAKIYARQGLYENAAEIYNNLLKQDPDRQDVLDALLELEKMKSENKKELKKSLVPLFSKWFDLALCHNRIVLLKKLNKVNKS
ncbi:MAG: tetratricopeptide repeat protein [Desulfobacterales bacterium]